MPSTDRKRGVEEQRDGRDASDVEGVAVREDAHEELSVGRSRRRVRGGVAGEWAAVEAVDTHTH